MTTTTKCQLDCGKPAGTDAYVCKDCIDTARNSCATIADLMAHVDEKRARWTGIDYRAAGPRSADTPLPYDPRVTKTVAPIITGLAGTHNVIAEHAGWHDALHRGNAPTVAHWIRERIDTLRTIPEGPDELRFLDRSADNLARLFDRPPDRLYLGQCGTTHHDTDHDETWTCTAYVYVERTKSLAPHATCPRCRTQIDVASRRDEFQEAVKLYQATMRELVHLAPMFLTEGVSRRTLHEWTRHGLLRPVGERLEVDSEGRDRRTPTYRIGDLVEARNVWEERKADRRHARKARSA